MGFGGILFTTSFVRNRYLLLLDIKFVGENFVEPDGKIE